MLKTVPLSFDHIELPSDVVDFLDDLNRRVEAFIKDKPFAKDGFVACDHSEIAKALIAIQDLGICPGNVFCEWGSGFGGVASVASLLGFESYGIEINREVFEHSVELASDYGLDVELIEGSFIPIGSDDLIDEAYLENDGDLTLESHYDDAYQEIGKEVADFDVTFVFPWPNEAPLLANIFQRFGADGALLMTFNDFSGLKVERK
jgi:hypothetical protein